MNINRPSKNNIPFQKHFLAWLPTFLWIVVVCYLSLTDSGLPKIKISLIFETDKLAHAIIYFILTYLLIRSFTYPFQAEQKAVVYIISAIIAIGFSILMEVLQKNITKTRQYDIHDIYANIIGTLLGVVVYLIIKQIIVRHKSVQDN